MDAEPEGEKAELAKLREYKRLRDELRDVVCDEREREILDRTVALTVAEMPNPKDLARSLIVMEQTIMDLKRQIARLYAEKEDKV